MRPGALESLQRGVLNLRANAELVGWLWLQRLTLFGLGLASLLPFYLVLEIEAPGTLRDPTDYLEWAVLTAESLLRQAATPPFWAATIAAGAIATLTLCVYSFFQAGAVGVLVRAERRAAAYGLRAFSFAELQRCGGRWLWRFFWLFNVLLLIWTVWMVLILTTFLVAGVVARGAGGLAALGIGCLALAPLAFFALVLVFWSWFSQAEIALRDRGTWHALLAGFGRLTGHLGTVVVLAILLTVLMAGSWLVFLLLSVTLDAALAGLGAAGALATLVVQPARWLVAAVVHLIFVAAVVHLAAGFPEPAASAVESA